MEGKNDSLGDVPREPDESHSLTIKWRTEVIQDLQPYPKGFDQACSLCNMSQHLVDTQKTAMRWVRVPAGYTLNTVSLPAGRTFNRLPPSGVVDPNGPIALQNVYNRVLSAHVVAEELREKSKEDLLVVMDKLRNRELDTYYRASYRFVRTEPLGHDRFGNEFWVLDAQAHNPLGCVGGKQSRGSALYDPCILMRSPQGTWARHSGIAVDDLIDSFSRDHPLEGLLRVKMAFDWNRARNQAATSSLKTRTTRHEWLKKARRIGEWVKAVVDTADTSANMQERGGLNVAESSKQLELTYARCLETRHIAHYSNITRSDFLEGEYDADGTAKPRDVEMRRRRVREVGIDLQSDCGGPVGYQRRDQLAGVRALSLCTTATRIFASPDTFFDAERGWGRHLRTPQFRYCPHVQPTENALLEPLLTADDEFDDDALPDDFMQDKLAYEATRAEKLEPGHFRASSREITLSKPVAMCDENQLLYTFTSGRLAVVTLGLCPDSIHLVCLGKKPTAHGFRWRYAFPEEVEKGLTGTLSLAATMNLFAKRQSTLRREDTIAPPKLALFAQHTGRTVPNNNQRVFERPSGICVKVTGPRPAFHLSASAVNTEIKNVVMMNSDNRDRMHSVVGERRAHPEEAPKDEPSTLVTVGHRLLRIKTELLNVVVALDERFWRWRAAKNELVAMCSELDIDHSHFDDAPPPDAPDKPEESAASDKHHAVDAPRGKRERKKTVKEGMVSGEDLDAIVDGSPRAPPSPVPAVQQAKPPRPGAPSPEEARVLRWQRKCLHAAFVHCVRKAATPRQMLALVWCLEQAVPRTGLSATQRWLLQLSRTAQVHAAPLVDDAITVGRVATRLYSLDRALRYERLPLDIGFEKSNYRPRILLGPRCMCSMKCALPLGHIGRCVEIFNDFSRVPEGLDTRAIELEMATWLKRAPKVSLSMGGGRRRAESESEDEFEDYDLDKPRKPPHEMAAHVVNIDAITPWCPRRDQCENTAMV